METTGWIEPEEPQEQSGHESTSGGTSTSLARVNKSHDQQVYSVIFPEREVLCICVVPLLEVFQLIGSIN